MGKPKSPKKQIARGIEAYKKTMKDGYLKTGRPPKEKQVPQSLFVENKEAPATSSKYRRAAQFMVLIGSEEASKILSRLENKQVEAISKEIVSIKNINPEEAEAVLEEFRALLSPGYGYSGTSYGGPEEARRILYAAFGPEKGEALLLKVVPEAFENPFDFLADFSAEQLSMLFKDESPAACAMVFSRLPSKLSAAVLANTSPERKLEIVKRIARLRETSPEVIQRAAAAIREKARHFGRDDAPGFAGGQVDGKGVLAAILKQSDISFGSQILDKLEKTDPSLSRAMKDRLYTLEDVCGAADRPIQEKLREMEDKEIVFLLRGRSETFTHKILGNISQDRVARVMDESEIMGPVPKIESEAAAREFLAWFRKNREEGRILMLSGEDVLV